MYLFGQRYQTNLFAFWIQLFQGSLSPIAVVLLAWANLIRQESDDRLQAVEISHWPWTDSYNRSPYPISSQWWIWRLPFSSWNWLWVSPIQFGRCFRTHLLFLGGDLNWFQFTIQVVLQYMLFETYIADREFAEVIFVHTPWVFWIFHPSPSSPVHFEIVHSLRDWNWRLQDQQELPYRWSPVETKIEAFIFQIVEISTIISFTEDDGFGMLLLNSSKSSGMKFS